MACDAEEMVARIEEEQTTMNAVIYTRLSPGERKTDRIGLDVQEAECRACAKREGCEEIVEIVSEDEVSGGLSLEKRTELIRAIDLLEKGDVLIVAKRDRLSRGDVLTTAMIERMIERRGARVVSAAGEGTGDDDPGSVLMRRMIDAFAEYERLVIGARTKAALQAKKARGERVGMIPFGYRLAANGVYLEEDAREQAALSLIARARGEGLSLRKIATRLVEEGHEPRGKKWHATSINRVLAEQKAA